MGCDWKLYQLLMFNFYQNSIKYNKKEGSIIISLSIERDENNEMNEKVFLVTKI